MPAIEKRHFANFTILYFKVPESSSLIQEILDEFQNAQEFHEYSHKIGGRWENTYTPVSLVPSSKKLFHVAIKTVSAHFNRSTLVTHSVTGMKNVGFWFNHMPPGSRTGLHDHKKNAFMSGVFYLDVPKNSGNLFFQNKTQEELEIKSESGKMLLFPPSIKHRVSENKSSGNRISLAFNLHTLPLEI